MTDTDGRIVLLKMKWVVIPVLLLVVGFGVKFCSDVAHAEEVVPDASDAPAAAEVVTDEPGLLDKLDLWWDGRKEKTKELYEKGVKETAVAVGRKVSDDTADDLEQEFNDQLGETETELIVDVSYDVRQIDCLTRALVFEAGGEPKFGKLWVLHVIDNRRDLQYRGMKSYCDVIFDRYQFSFANFNPDRVPGYTQDLVESKKLAVEFYYGQPEDVTNCATHYLAHDTVDPMDVKWARQAMEGDSPENLRPIAVIGGHTFFGPTGCNL